MKKLAPFIFLILFFLILIILIPKATVETDVLYVNSFDIPNSENINVCVLNKQNKLALVNVEKHKNENLYLYILKLYDHYRNNLPFDYKSPLNGNFEVINLEKSNNTLDIELDLLYLNGELNEFLTALSWSYGEVGIEKINLLINGNKFTLKKNQNINVQIEDPYLKTKQVIYYQADDGVIPITYFHNDEKIDFLVEKLTNKYKVIDIEIQIYDTLLMVYIDDPEEVLTENIIKLVIKSIDEFDVYENIIIILNENEIYNN